MLTLGPHTGFPFLLFIPYSAYIYVMWNIPSTVLTYYMTDKYLLSLLFLFLFIPLWPHSFLAVFSSVIAYTAFEFDLFRIRSAILSKDEENLIQEAHIYGDLPAVDEQPQPMTPLQTLLDMGFGVDEAGRTLEQMRGDLNAAIESLLPI